MAEIFGAVAGGAGLVFLAIQLLDSAQKLEKFHSSYKGAPKKLSQIAFDIKTISLALRQIEADRVQHDVSDQELLTRCLQTCQQSTEKIVMATEKLERLFAKSKIAAKIAVAFQEPALEALFIELEQSKTALHLAWSLYTESVRRHDLQMQNQTMLAMQLFMQQSFQRISRRPPTGDDGSLADTATCAQTASVSLAAKRLKTKTIFQRRVTLPYWLTNRAWSFALSTSEDGWTFALSTIRLVPSDSEIFEACLDGDIVRVQDLFASGKASIYDTWTARDGKGRVTPLENAFRSGNMNLCRFLLKQGRRCDQLLLLVQTRFNVYRVTENDEIIALLAHYLEREGYLRSLNGSFERRFIRNLPIGNLEGMLPLAEINRYVEFPIQTWPMRSRIEATTCLEDIRDVVNFRRFLGLETETKLQQACLEHGSELLLSVMRKIEKHNWRPRLGPQWVRFAQLIESLGAAVDGRSSASALHFLLQLSSHLYSEPRKSYDNMSSLLRTWIQPLHTANIDLREYGLRQKQLWSAWQASNDATAMEALSLGHPRRLDFDFGPLPEDWKLRLHHSRVLQKWTLKTACLPGSWPKQDVLPQIIFWEPRYHELAEGHWERTGTIELESISTTEEGLDYWESGLGSVPWECFYDDDVCLSALLARPRENVTRQRHRRASEPQSAAFLRAHLLEKPRTEIRWRAFWDFHFCPRTCRLAYGRPGSPFISDFSQCYQDCTSERDALHSSIAASMRKARADWKQKQLELNNV